MELEAAPSNVVEKSPACIGVRVARTTLVGDGYAIVEDHDNEGGEALECRIPLPPGIFLRPGTWVGYTPSDENLALAQEGAPIWVRISLGGNGYRPEPFSNERPTFPANIGTLRRYAPDNSGTAFFEVAEIDRDVYAHHSTALNVARKICRGDQVAFDLHFNAGGKPQVSVPMWGVIGQGEPDPSMVPSRSGGLMSIADTSETATVLMFGNEETSARDQGVTTMALLTQGTATTMGVGLAPKGAGAPKKGKGGLLLVGETIRAPTGAKVQHNLGTQRLHGVASATSTGGKGPGPGGANYNVAASTVQSNSTLFGRTATNNSLKNSPRTTAVQNKQLVLPSAATSMRLAADTFPLEQLETMDFLGVRMGTLTGEFTPDGDHQIIMTMEQEMIFVENSLLADYDVAAGQDIAFNVAHNDQGNPLVDIAMPMWMLSSPFKTNDEPRFGSYVGKVHNFSSAGNAFVKCDALRKLYDKDAFVHQKVVHICGLALGDVIYFDIHLNESQSPQVSAPVWIKCENGGRAKRLEQVAAQNSLQEMAQGLHMNTTADHTSVTRGATMPMVAPATQSSRTIRAHQLPRSASSSSSDGPLVPGLTIEGNSVMWELMGCQNGSKQAHMDPAAFEHEGRLHNVNKMGNGYIKSQTYRGEADIFVHSKVVERCSLQVGDTVRFNIHISNAGNPQCSAPVLIGRQGAVAPSRGIGLPKAAGLHATGSSELNLDNPYLSSEIDALLEGADDLYTLGGGSTENNGQQHGGALSQVTTNTFSDFGIKSRIVGDGGLLGSTTLKQDYTTGAANQMKKLKQIIPLPGTQRNLDPLKQIKQFPLSQTQKAATSAPALFKKVPLFGTAATRRPNPY
ncbi:unnamed protein product [Amoebophrya sp. A25]|nr:unnamed protein product [Amoebophrya sp. A25]|eukprot:GSA25T00005984001.1